MEYKISKEKNKVSINITLAKDEWAKEIESAYERTKGKYEVQGFRKGKAPRKAIENAYGSMVFFDDALDEVFKKNYVEIVTKEDLAVIEQPALAINKLDEENFDITLTVEVEPEVKLGNYKGLEIKKAEVKVSEEHIDHHIQEMAERNARRVEITDRAVENGDITNIDFSGSIDGVKFEGGTAEGYELVIGSHSFIAGFEEQLIGMNVGEERDIKVTFPADYPSEEIKGKEAVFAIKLHKIEVKEMPEINDEWASNVSEFETLQELRDDIAKHDEEHAKQHAETQENNELIEKVVANAEVEVSNVLVERELDYMMEDISNKLMYQGFTLEQYCEMMGKKVEEIKEEQRDVAITNCKTRLVIETIIKKENIKVEQSDIDAKLQELCERFNKTLEEIKENFPQEQLMYLENEIIMDKFLAFLRENNKIA
ncbi:MAG: trigger factor [Clostridia bacterium]|nr:trigger factor [Clostridia bacterium]